MSEPARCPCCSATLPQHDDILLDLDGGFIARGGQLARLRDTQFKLFMELWNVKPRSLSREQLLDRLYALRPNDEPEAKIVDVFICQIRKELQPLGIVVETLWGRGYRIKPERNDQ